MSKEREALKRAGGAMANILYNLKQGSFGTERIREQMDEAQSAWDKALQDVAALSPEASAVDDARHDPEHGGTWSDGGKVFEADPVASPPASAGVRVKALEWRIGYSDKEVSTLQSNTLGGIYQIRLLRNGTVWLDAGQQTYQFPTDDAAKAAAQADYEARILSALEPAAHPYPAPVSGEDENAKIAKALRNVGLELKPVADGDGAWHYEVYQFAAPADLPASPATGESVTEALIDVLRLAYSCGYTDRPGDRSWPDNAERLVKALTAAIAAKPGWRSMDSAPKDGTKILGYGRIDGGHYWRDASWHGRRHSEPVTAEIYYAANLWQCRGGVMDPPLVWQPMPADPVGIDAGDMEEIVTERGPVGTRYSRLPAAPTGGE